MTTWTTEPAPLVVGAVAYNANVVPIWEGMREYFSATSTPIDFLLFSSYERQVEALLAGVIDIGWNTNVAWARCLAQSGGRVVALAMRDTDQRFTSVFVSRAGAGIEDLAALRGRTVAFGSRDSGQARILPIHFLSRAGLGSADYRALAFDSDVGKHGDTGRSDLDALRAVLDDSADVAAIGVNTWEGLRAGGDDAVADLHVVWESEPYNHCNFTCMDVLDVETREEWVANLLAMSWDVPEQRRILELEGLREWRLAELDGYRSLHAAMAEQGISDHW